MKSRWYLAMCLFFIKVINTLNIAMNNNYIGVDLDLFRQPKIQRLELKHGKGAVALYLQICLKLAEQEGQISLDDIPILSREFFAKEETIKDILEFQELFIFENNYFFCDWINEKINILNKKKKAAKNAGLASGRARKQKRTDVQQTFNEIGTDDEQLNYTILNYTKRNEREGNENKNKETTLKQNLEILEKPNYLEIKDNPLFPKTRMLKFPDLTDAEIDLELETFLWDYPKSKATSIFNYLSERNNKKRKELKQNNPTSILNGVQGNIIDASDFDTLEEFKNACYANQSAKIIQPNFTRERIWSENDKTQNKTQNKTQKFTFKKIL